MNTDIETRPTAAEAPLFSLQEKLIGLFLLLGALAYVAAGVVFALADSTLRVGGNQIYSAMTFVIQVAAWPLLLGLGR